ncbi:iron ABC transporter permease [Desulfocarbo indianensis]|nr:iron ABC transporter permease [Desulfocarbo indianensis]
MKPSEARNHRAMAVLPLLALTMIVVFWLSLNVGSVNSRSGEVWRIIWGAAADANLDFIVRNIRLPRALAALGGGAMLAVSGLLLQVFFRNPIVGPFVLGISSGATLMVSLVMLTSVAVGMVGVVPYLTPLAAFAGALGAMSLVMAVASRVKQGVTLLITGIMIGYLTSAVTSLLITFAEAERIKGFNLWQLGSFSGYTWTELALMMSIGSVLLVLVYGISKQLNAFLLGENYAATMGVNIRRFRIALVFVSCGLSALVTATAGPVAFVGLAVPHMARLAMGTSDNKLLIPATALIGAVVCGACDIVARMLFAPVEAPLSAITSFFGAPVVIMLLLRNRVKQ